MSVLSKLSEHIHQKGLRATLGKVWRHYVYSHEELLWMERDLVSPVPPHKLRPYEPLRMETITAQNAVAFSKHFGDRVGTMAELANEGHTGHMYLNEDGDAVAFIWGSKRDYHDRHYYGCWFPVKPGEFFEFGGEQIRAYWGSTLSVDFQLNLWKAMADQGCNKVVDVCEFHNIAALKLHIRMGYHEQGRIMNVYHLFGHWRFYRETRYSGSRLDALRKPSPAPVTATAA
ncbi:N-acetyltransferase [Pseudomonas sp. B2M1-30]|uniref:N-acetyltransferase n=1 Tax=Pseudomonas TaxID=286 RepID=UPI001C3DF724|nr:MULTISPECIES: N-acetyltransferase [Pseudomonas]MBV4477904.1 N-acetyltransferase [Pseudomonas botevensis]MCU0122189.1 N-acetyltransferase [Pseudomonas sp. B2M1-30]MCU7264442.1 N-acetyltransferase [Pseudomonas koreensis]